MAYMIVRWQPHDMEWVVLHYSHLYDDAMHWLDYFRERFEDVKLMIEAESIKKEEAKSLVKTYMENLLKKQK